MSYKNIYNRMIGASNDKYEMSMKVAIKERYKIFFEAYFGLTIPAREAAGRPGFVIPDWRKDKAFDVLTKLKEKVNHVVNESNRDLTTNQFNQLCTCYFIREGLFRGYDEESKPSNGGKMLIVDCFAAFESIAKQLSWFLKWREKAPKNGASCTIWLGNNLLCGDPSITEKGVWLSDRQPKLKAILLTRSQKFSSMSFTVTDSMFAMLEKYLPQEFRLR